MRAAKPEDAKLLCPRYFPLSRPVRTPALLLQGFKMIGMVPPFPFIESFSGNAEVAAGQGGGSTRPIVVHPLPPFLGFRRQIGEGSQRTKSSPMLDILMVHRYSIQPRPSIMYLF